MNELAQRAVDLKEQNSNANSSSLELDEIEQQAVRALASISCVWERILIMLHPFCPTVTEVCPPSGLFDGIEMY